MLVITFLSGFCSRLFGLVPTVNQLFYEEAQDACPRIVFSCKISFVPFSLVDFDCPEQGIRCDQRKEAPGTADDVLHDKHWAKKNQRNSKASAVGARPALVAAEVAAASPSKSCTYY